MKSKEELKEYIFSLSWMEGAIGGSALDELREAMHLSEMHDGDIVFKLVAEPDINLNDYLGSVECPPGHTFEAYCTRHECEDFILVIDGDYLAWNPIWDCTQ